MRDVQKTVKIGNLRSGDRFRDIAGRVCTFDRWYKNSDDAVIATVDGGTTDIYAACADVCLIQGVEEVGNGTH